MKNLISIYGHGFYENYGRHCVSVSHALSYLLDRNPSNKLHFHPEYEFNLVVSGSGKYYDEGRSYTLSAGDIFVSNPNKIHEISSLETKDLQILWTNVTIENLQIPVTDSYEDQLIAAFLENHAIFQKKNSQLLHFYPQFKRLSSSPLEFRLSGKLLIKSFFFSFLEILTKKKPSFRYPESEINNIPADTINKAHDFIINNLTIPISVSDVAGAVGCTERNLRYTFRKHLNCTVIAYIQNRKYEYACHLLRLGLQVQEVSQHLGIENPSLFSRSFKKRMGLSPMQYIKKQYRNHDHAPIYQ